VPMRRAAFTALAFTALLATAASAATITKSFTQTAHVKLQATPSGCDNNPGPFITLNGELALSGASARITLSNNTKGTHTASTTFANQPPLGGAGGNPIISVQFVGGSGELLGSPIVLGRCNQL